MRPLRLAPALVALLLSGGAAQAGIFDDEEARKAIVDLRNRVSAVDSRVTESTAQLTEQLAALRKSLLDLNNQLEAMRGEIAKLRGNDEQMARDLGEVQRKQKDIGQAMDDRLRRLEPVKIALDGREFMAEQDERKAYDDAIATIRAGEFEKAIGMLANFQRRFPASGYVDSVRFWLGNAQYGKRDYKDAIATFRAFIASAPPDNPRVPEAMLAVANSQAEMKDARGARKTIDELMKAYPQSEAAQAGKDRLASIK